MAKTTGRELHALWRDRVRRQATSGLTITRFCTKERLSRASFHSWKRRLRLVEQADRSPVLLAPAPPAFLPVAVRGSEPTVVEPALIEADLPNGIRLRIPTANTRLACQLVRAVARAKTESGGSR